MTSIQGNFSNAGSGEREIMLRFGWRVFYTAFPRADGGTRGSRPVSL